MTVSRLLLFLAVTLFLILGFGAAFADPWVLAHAWVLAGFGLAAGFGSSLVP